MWLVGTHACSPALVLITREPTTRSDQRAFPSVVRAARIRFTSSPNCLGLTARPRTSQAFFSGRCDVNVQTTLSIVVMALGLSVLATLYPSWRASRLDPVEALRYE